MTTRPDELPSGADLERYLESIETAMYEDFYRAMPPAIVEAMGIEARRVGAELHLTAREIDHPAFNRVAGVGLDAPAEHAVAPAVDHYHASGIRRWMLQVLPHAESPEFRATCSRFGLEKLRGWAKHTGTAVQEIPFKTDLRVVRLDDPDRPTPIPGDHIADRRLTSAWADIVIETFAMHPACHPWLEALSGRERWHLYLAMDGDNPAATAALYVHDSGIAQLNFAGTRDRYRRHGGQSALIARRFSDARAMGIRWIVTETDEELPDRPNPSYHNMVRLGLPVRYVRANWGPLVPSPETRKVHR